MESFAVEGIAMSDTSANPIFVALLFILRCLVPLAILFGVSYLLRKLGLVAVETPEPPEEGGEASAQQEIIEENPKPSASDPNQTSTVETPKES